MAKFQFHGHPETVEQLKDELPKDGTAWDQYLLEAVRLRNGSGPGRAKAIRNLDRWDELQLMIPDGGVDTVDYLIECVEMRQKVESRDLVLADPQTVQTK